MTATQEFFDELLFGLCLPVGIAVHVLGVALLGDVYQPFHLDQS